MIPPNCLVAESVPVAVDGEEFVLDMLLYFPGKRRHIVIVTRDEPFDAGHVSLVNFLAEVVDRQIAQPGDQQTIGLILCDSMHNLKYTFLSLLGWRRPIGVAVLPPENASIHEKRDPHAAGKGAL